MSRPLQYPQKLCWCGQPALTVKRIRRYQAQGRLESKWAAHFVPRADMPPPPRFCLHHMVRHLTVVYGGAVQKKFWGDRLTRRRRNEAAWRQTHPCHARRTNGAQCCAPAKRGGLYCHAHEPRAKQLWSLLPRSMGLQCTATSVTTGLQCKNCAVRPHGVCWQHGAKAIRATEAIAARPYNAVETAARKAKQRRHQDYARLRAAGRAPMPQKESLSRQTLRRAREETAEHRLAVLQGREMPDGEREFREHHARRSRPLPPLYDC